MTPTDRAIAEKVHKKLQELRSYTVQEQIKGLAKLTRLLRRPGDPKRAAAHQAISKLWELLATAPRADLPKLWEDAVRRTDEWRKG
jgi:hypothetical protein